MTAFPGGLTATELLWLTFAALLAGIVRGFSGFGSAMVFMPVAARIVDPVSAVLTLAAMELFGPLVNVPKSLKHAHLPDLGKLGLGILLGVPIGVALLRAVPPEEFRLAVSILTLAMLAVLAAGVRYRGRLGAPLIVLTGWVSGIIGGATTLFGPVTILFYMASTLRPRTIRANLNLYLLMSNAVLLAVLGLSGTLAVAPLLLGLALLVPYGLANLVGAAIFRPEAARGYRAAAYAIIALTGLSGLPIFG